MRRVLTFGILVLLASCTSVEWAEPAPELPTSWRHYRLFVSDAAYVLARDEDAAAEAHELAAEARKVLTAEFERDPGRGLILALSFDDPLPIEDPDAYTVAISDWRRRVTGIDAPPMNLDPNQHPRPGQEPVEIDPRVPLHIVGTPLPLDQTELDLPPALVEASTFVAILPTTTALGEAADELIELMCEAQGISTVMLWTMAAVAGHPATLMRNKLLEQTKITLYDAWLPAFGADPARAFAVKQRAGLIDPEAEWQEPPPAPERGTSWTELITKEMRFADAPPRFIVAERPADDLMHLLTKTNWQGFVDLRMRPDPTTAQMLRAAGRTYVYLPQQTLLPTRADAERLGALHAELAAAHGTEYVFVFVYGDHEYAAALVASHAFWVLGKSKAEAFAIAEHYGVGPTLSILADAWEPKQ